MGSVGLMPAWPCGVLAQVEGMNWNSPVAPEGFWAVALPPDSQALTRLAQPTAPGPSGPKADWMAPELPTTGRLTGAVLTTGAGAGSGA